MPWPRILPHLRSAPPHAAAPEARLNALLRALPSVPPQPPALTLQADGAYSYPCLSTDELLTMHRQEIYAIMQRLPFDRAHFASTILPLIEAAAACAGILPASQGCHDIRAGGLFAHSLKVCILSLEDYKRNVTHTRCDPHRGGGRAALAPFVALVVMSLAHDLGKIFTDMLVCCGGKTFDPYAMTLAAFLAASSCTTCRVYFREQRRCGHDEMLAVAMLALLAQSGGLRLLGMIDPGVALPEIMTGAGLLWEIVRRADHNAVRLGQAPGRYQYDAPCYAVTKLAQEIGCRHLPYNSPDGDLFVHDPHWLLVAYDSAAVSLLSVTLATMWIGEDIAACDDPLPDALGLLARRGYIKILGRNRIYSWFRLTLGEDLLYVYGFLIKIPAPNTPAVTCKCLGPAPQELAVLLQLLKSHPGLACPGRIVLKGQAQCSTPLTAAQLNEDSIRINPARQHYRELLRQRENQCRSTQLSLQRSAWGQVRQDWAARLPASLPTQCAPPLADGNLSTDAQAGLFPGRPDPRLQPPAAGPQQTAPLAGAVLQPPALGTAHSLHADPIPPLVLKAAAPPARPDPAAEAITPAAPAACLAGAGALSPASSKPPDNAGVCATQVAGELAVSSTKEVQIDPPAKKSSARRSAAARTRKSKAAAGGETEGS